MGAKKRMMIMAQGEDLDGSPKRKTKGGLGKKPMGPAMPKKKAMPHAKKGAMSKAVPSKKMVPQFVKKAAAKKKAKK